MRTPRESRIRILEAVLEAADGNEPLDVEALARKLRLESDEIESELDAAQSLGLILAGIEEGVSPILLSAGRQYLAANGDPDSSVLRFLPMVDDLNARATFLHAGSVLVDEFRYALLAGDAVSHAQTLVPEAFVEAVDERLALDLFAAAVALPARLSEGAPAGCVGEEVMAVSLIEEARGWLALRREMGEITPGDEQEASDELRSLFELFQDEDVLDLFEMSEPADAAVAGHTFKNRQMGIANQRLDAWFRPFAWTSPTGYLSEPDDDESPQPGME